MRKKNVGEVVLQVTLVVVVVVDAMVDVEQVAR